MSSAPARLPAWADYGLVPLINLVAAFLVCRARRAAGRREPVCARRILVDGAFGYGEGIGFTLYYATNFIFTGLAVAVAFHAGLFNIGGEGQAYIGGLGVALVALGARHCPAVVAGLSARDPRGGDRRRGVGAAPRLAAGAFGSHIVITTIMFNFIAASLMVYLLANYFRRPARWRRRRAPSRPAAHCRSLDWLFALFGADLGGARSTSSCSSRWSRRWRLAADLAHQARLRDPHHRAQPEGRPLRRHLGDRITIVTMLISGALAGMMALNPIMGDQHRLQLDFVQGAGFVGIAVALMGRSHPVGIVLAAILFGMLYQGGAELAFEMPAISRDMIVIIQGLVILFAGALEHMFRPSLTRALRPHVARAAAAHGGRQGRRLMDFQLILLVLDSTIRLSVPLLLAASPGSIPSAPASSTSGWKARCWRRLRRRRGRGGHRLGLARLGAAILVSVVFALVHGFASITHRGNQIVSGVAINFIAAG